MVFFLVHFKVNENPKKYYIMLQIFFQYFPETASCTLNEISISVLLSLGYHEPCSQYFDTYMIHKIY